MFAGCIQLTTVNNMDSWNVSGVTNMGGMFADCHLFDQPLNSWDVSSVTNMGGMFTECYVFNQPLNLWDVSLVQNMGFMFRQCYDFDQNIDTEKLTNAIANLEKMLLIKTIKFSSN